MSVTRAVAPTNGARLRARAALTEADLAGLVSTLERVASNVNEVWFAGPFVLRVCPHPSSRRLEHEVGVASRLPAGFPYPPVVGHGRGSYGEWLVMRRVAGEPLSRSWPHLRESYRRAAVSQMADALRALHQVPADDSSTTAETDSLECPHQLPPGRLLHLLHRAARLPHVDPLVIETAIELVLRCRDAVDEPPHHFLVHGDLHLENVLWDGDGVAAVLDLEWARPGPADLDLDVLLRFCADPAPHVDPDYGHLALASDYRSVPGWLRQDYPGLFDHPRLEDRLAVYCLAYDVRQLLLDPPSGPQATLPHHHPERRIRRLVEGRSHLPLLDW